jgi:hypothetical protein
MGNSAELSTFRTFNGATLPLINHVPWLVTQHIHSLPTGPILGMRRLAHGLAAQPFTDAKNRPG